MGKIILALCTILVSSFAHTNISNADTVNMTFGGNPPYIFPDKGNGIELDIVREALAYKGHKLVPVFVPVRRVVKELSKPNIDAVANVTGQEVSGDGLFPGDQSIYYQDILFTLSDRSIEISTPADMDNLRVVTFPTAVKIYPKWLKKAAEQGRYNEVSDQMSQVLMLSKGRADVVLADINIMKYLVNKMAADTGKPKIAITESFSVGGIGATPVFKSKAIRDDFNAGMAWLKSSGQYDKIVARYTTK